MKNEPLFLPAGSVRSILILILTVAILFFLWQNVNIPESVLVLWAGAFGWYFGLKNNNIK